MIRRRHVFYVAGYDPIGAREQYYRFRREYGVFLRNWGFTSKTSELLESGDGVAASWLATTRGVNWQVDNTYELLLWDDLVRADLAKPDWSRLKRAFAVLAKLTLNGTLIRYFAANWRFGFYFLYPYLYTLGFALVALFAGAAIGRLAGAIPAVQWTLTAVVAVAVFFAMMRWIGRRRRINHALDNCIFAHDHVRGYRRDVDARIDRFSERIRAVIASPDVDEVVIVGHSVGATLAVQALARALEAGAAEGAAQPAIGFLTVGSTIPKFTLQPSATAIRNLVERVARSPSVLWSEVQASLDWISFYGFDPVRLRRIAATESTSQPHIRIVHLRDLIDFQKLWRNPLRTLWRFPRSLMRLHYQLVLANRRRAAYDYFMTTCGPFSFAALDRAPGGAVELFAGLAAQQD